MSHPFEPSTRTLRRAVLQGLATKSPHDVAAMVTAARGRGKAWRTFEGWFGPRASCPAALRPLLDRAALLAHIEAG